MKLLLCVKCADIFTILPKPKAKDPKAKIYCRCRKTWGRYLDERQAEYAGDYAVPMGIDNSDLFESIDLYQKGKRLAINLFLIKPNAKTFRHVPFSSKAKLEEPRLPGLDEEKL